MTRTTPDDGASAVAWDRLARRYAGQERWERRAVDAALATAAVAPHERLLDLATGTGLVLRRLSAAATRPREAIGIDRSAGMLERVGALPEGWSTRRGDARSVALPDGWADVVTCAYLLQLLDRVARREVLLEARRLLTARADARLVVVTVSVDVRRAGGRVAHAALDAAARMRPAAWGGLRPLDPRADLVAAGFVVARAIRITRRGYPSLVVLARPARRLGGRPAAATNVAAMTPAGETAGSSPMDATARARAAWIVERRAGRLGVRRAARARSRRPARAPRPPRSAGRRLRCAERRRAGSAPAETPWR